MDTKKLAFELHYFIEKMDISRDNKIKLHNKIIDTITQLIEIDIIYKEFIKEFKK